MEQKCALKSWHHQKPKPNTNKKFFFHKKAEISLLLKMKNNSAPSSPSPTPSQQVFPMMPLATCCLHGTQAPRAMGQRLSGSAEEFLVPNLTSTKHETSFLFFSATHLNKLFSSWI